MLLAHLAALVAAQGPARVAVDLGQVRRWTVRGAALLPAAGSLWVLGRVVTGHDPPEWLPGRLTFALGLVVLTLLAIATTRALDGRRAGV